MIEMTFNEALKIQRAQMAYYRQTIGLAGVRAIKAQTIYPVDIEPDTPMEVIEINRLVPRGGSFENLLRNRPSVSDSTKLAQHDAIKRGILWS